MGSLGETLRQARLDRGASLDAAEQETRIRRRYLEALESEDYGGLPAVVYVRGFIRSYARYLGLDPESTLDLYAPGRVREDRSVLRAATPQLGPGRPVSTRILMLVAGLLLSGLLLAYLWGQYNSFVDSLGQAEQRTAARPTAATASAVPTPAPASAPPTSAPAAPTLAGAVASPTAGVVATPTPSSTSAPVATPQDRGVVVEARTTDRTWVEVWIDGSSQLQATLPAGAARNFAANQSVRMRVGNAGAVQVTVNGDPKGALGEKNQVREFVWER